MSLEEYNERLNERTRELRAKANSAKDGSDDPQEEVEIRQAEDMAERCQQLLEEEIGNLDGLTEAIRHYEETTDLDREEISFKIADQFIDGELGGDELDRETRIEAAVRTAVALLTEGVVAAPIEGIGGVDIQNNDDGTEYIRLHFNGPIRSAGGTGQALSVLVADHVRQGLGIDEFKPRDIEVERYKEEIKLYDDETGLQYSPKDKELETIIEYTPVMLDGMTTSNREVEGYKDLERIDGNNPRGGMCLVAAEGIAQKAPKIQRIVDDIDMDGWSWLTKLSTVTLEEDDEEDEGEADDGEEQEEINYDEINTQDAIDYENLEQPVFDPATKFQKKITAGRPIFSGPSARGGFRLRYGRARNTGIAASGFHPATMIAMEEFLGPGVQLKTERPGKAQGAAPVDTIEGPTVRLKDGTVRQLNTEEEAEEVRDEIEHIIDVGEMLVNYGEFLENNHPLAPSPYNVEWWTQDLENKGMPTEHLEPETVDFETAKNLSDKWDIPLHPDHSYLWMDIEPEQYHELSKAMEFSESSDEEHYDYTIPNGDDTQLSTTLEHLLVPHKQTDDKLHLNELDYTRLQYFTDSNIDPDNYETALGCVNEATPHEIMPRVTTRIGARMGRPEKSDIRQMSSTVHGLFPIGEAGGNQRNLVDAANNTEGGNYSFDESKDEYSGKGNIEVELNNRICTNCQTQTWETKCPICQNRTQLVAQCYECGDMANEDMADESCDNCRPGKYKLSSRKHINLHDKFTDTLDDLGIHPTQTGKIKGVKGLSSVSKTPESIEKPILRAKHDVYPFRDGSVRYDMVDLPLTAFKPEEVEMTIEQAHELGYTEDINGDPLEDPTQTVELYPQDVIISHDAGRYMLQTAEYVDELLEKYYDEEPHYNAETKEDLIGELMIGLAPHTSAGVVGRIIGFSNNKAQLAHPIFHAAKRRNCFSPDTELSYKINGDWKRTTIEELVESHLTDDADDDYADGSIVQDVEDHPEIEELKVPSMTDDGHRTLEPVESLTRNEDKERLVEITLSSGESLEVTPDHTLETYENGDLVEKNAISIEEGDEFPHSPQDHLEYAPDWNEFDLLEVAVESEEVDNENIMIRGMSKDDLEALYRDSQGIPADQRSYLPQVAENVGMNKKTISNYLYRDSVPASILSELYDDTDDMLQKVPNNVEIGVKRDHTQSPRMVTVDEELATLMGYYTAEGFTRITNNDTRGKNETGVRQVDIASIEPEVRDFYKRVFEKKFNVENAYEEEKRVTASGTLVSLFFEEVIESGNYAIEKKVPELIKNASEDIQASYLSGYISGDGSTSKNSTKINMHTISTDLRDELMEMLADTFGYDPVYDTEQGVNLYEKFPEFYDEDCERDSETIYTVRLNSDDATDFIESYGIHLKRKEQRASFEKPTVSIVDINTKENKDQITYNITVNNTHRIPAVQGLYPANCDGDEDCIILLLDCLLNFSRDYLPDAIGRRIMDAPLVNTSVIDPTEIDDEAYNVDVVPKYDRQFYIQTWDMPGPKEVDIEVIEDRLEDPSGIQHTTETTDVNAGPYASRYPKLDGMDSKVELQLELADKTRAADVKTVASKVVQKHFFPDIRGNLRAYAQQDFRCTRCNTKYRRPPLNGDCMECEDGGNLGFTVYEGMIRKYLKPTLDIAEEYEMNAYVRQQLEEIQNEINSIFEKDTEEQTGLDDFL